MAGRPQPGGPGLYNSVQNLASRNDALIARLNNEAAQKEHQYALLDAQVRAEREAAARHALARYETENGAKTEVGAAISRIAELEGELNEMSTVAVRNDQPWRELLARLLAERDILKSHVERLLALRQSEMAPPGAPIDYGALQMEYQRLLMQNQQIQAQHYNQLHDKDVIVGDMHYRLNDLVYKYKEAKVDADILLFERDELAREIEAYRFHANKLMRDIAGFEREKADYARSVFSQNNYDWLQRTEAELRATRFQLQQVLEAKEEAERMFYVELQERHRLESLAEQRGVSVDPEVEAVKERLDAMTLEVQRLRQQNREIERQKDEEIVELKNRLGAAFMDTSQAVAAYQRERLEYDTLADHYTSLQNSTLPSQSYMSQPAPQPQPQPQPQPTRPVQVQQVRRQPQQQVQYVRAPARQSGSSISYYVDPVSAPPAARQRLVQQRGRGRGGVPVRGRVPMRGGMQAGVRGRGPVYGGPRGRGGVAVRGRGGMPVRGGFGARGRFR